MSREILRSTICPGSCTALNLPSSSRPSRSVINIITETLLMASVKQKM